MSDFVQSSHIEEVLSVSSSLLYVKSYYTHTHTHDIVEEISQAVLSGATVKGLMKCFHKFPCNFILRSFYLFTYLL